VADVIAEAKQPFDQLRKEVESEVRYANITIIEGTGASQYGIGMVSARLAEAILRDEHAVMPVSSFNPEYGVSLALPSVLGRRGVERILRPEMSAQEREGLQRSADALRVAIAHLNV
jgi:L-lactate dehydrogenase